VREPASCRDSKTCRGWLRKANGVGLHHERSSQSSAQLRARLRGHGMSAVEQLSGAASGASCSQLNTLTVDQWPGPDGRSPQQREPHPSCVGSTSLARSWLAGVLEIRMQDAAGDAPLSQPPVPTPSRLPALPASGIARSKFLFAGKRHMRTDGMGDDQTGEWGPARCLSGLLGM
jgi:hypothetical protein